MSTNKKKLIFPTKLKILENVYKIKYIDGTIEHPDGDDVEGWVDFITNTIHVNCKPEFVTVWNTIFHEVGHVLVEELRLPLNEKQEEMIMNLIGMGMTSVIFDNKLKFDFRKMRKLDE